MNQHTRLARHFTSLQALGFVTILAACGGGGVSVPDGVVVNPPPSTGSPPPPPPPAPPAPNPQASTCIDPAPTVTQTAGFDAATAPANSGTAVSTNGGTVCFSASTTGAVRSNTAISPGGYYYFEATRSNSVSIGVGTSAAPVAPTGAATSDIASTSQSLLISNGSVYSNGAVIPSFNVGNETKFGIAVDYRGAHPVVYVLGSTQTASTANLAAGYCSGANVTVNATTPCVYGRYMLGAVTAPVFIYATGNSSNGGNAGTVSINTGGNETAKPFFYAPLSVRQAVRARFFQGELGLNTQWVGTSAAPASGLPSVTPGARTRSVLQVGDPSPFFGSDSFSVNAPAGSSVRWLSDTGAPLGSTATLSLTDPTVRGLITVDTGPHRLQAVVTDSVTSKLNAAEFIVTYTTTTTPDDDGDGLTYAQEKAATTDPANPDTDADGLSDGAEVALGKNPISPDNTAGQRVELRRESGLGNSLDTSAGVVLDSDKLSIALTSQLNADCLARIAPFDTIVSSDETRRDEQCKKRAIRATEGIKPGEFRYYETHRLLTLSTSDSGLNMGQGFITRTGRIDPFCCVQEDGSATPVPGTPPSFMLNSAAGIWVSLVPTASYNTTATSYVGFAVDYRGSSPVAYAITNDASPTVSGPYPITGFSGGDAIPFVYGHPQSDSVPAIEINFGLKKFHYDTATVRSLLTGAGVPAPDVDPSTGAFKPGVGIHQRP